MALYKIFWCSDAEHNIVEEKEFNDLFCAYEYVEKLQDLDPINQGLVTPTEDYVDPAYRFYDLVEIKNSTQNQKSDQSVQELTTKSFEEKKAYAPVKEQTQKPKGTGRVKLTDEERAERKQKLESERAERKQKRDQERAERKQKLDAERDAKQVKKAIIAFFAIITICGVIFLLMVLCGNIFSWGEKQYYYHYYSVAEQHLLNQRADYNASVVDNFVNRIEEHKNACEMPNTNHEWGCQFNEIEAWTIHFTWYSDFVLNNLRQEHEDRLFAEKMKRAQKYMGE